MATQRKGGRLAVLLPAAAEGAASGAVLGYGPLYMRQVLGEPSLTVTTLMLALASLAWFLAAGAWGRVGDRLRRPLAPVGWALLMSAAAQGVLPFAPNSAAFIAIVVFWACVLAAVAPLSVSWLTLQAPDRPAQEAAGFYRMRSVGWTVGSLGTSLLVGVLDVAGIAAAFRMGAVLSVVVAAAALAGLRRGETVPEPWERRAAAGTAAAGVAAAGDNAAGVIAGDGSATGATAGDGLVTGATAVDVAASDEGNLGEAAPMVPGHGASASAPIWRLQAVATLLGVILLTVTGNEAFFAVLGPYLTEHLGGSLEYVGISMGVASFLGIVVMGPLGRLADSWGAERVLVAGCLGYVAVYGLVALLQDPLATLILFGMPMFPFMSAGATGTIARRTPPERRAEAVGLYEGTSSLAGSFGSLLGGTVADMVGLARVPLMSVMLAACGAALAWLRLRSGYAAGRRQPAAENTP